jgi:hypothetical protein
MLKLNTEACRKVGRLASQFSDRSEVLVETLGEVNHHVLKKIYIYTHAILNAVGKKSVSLSCRKRIRIWHCYKDQREVLLSPYLYFLF